MNFREFVDSDNYWFCLALFNLVGMIAGLCAGNPALVIANGIMCLVSCYLFCRGI